MHLLPFTLSIFAFVILRLYYIVSSSLYTYIREIDKYNMASLSGKLENEVELHVPAAKFFEVFTTQLHEIQNISDSVHDTKLHQGDDWHAVDSQSVKNWTIVLGTYVNYLPNISDITLYI